MYVCNQCYKPIGKFPGQACSSQFLGDVLFHLIDHSVSTSPSQSLNSDTKFTHSIKLIQLYCSKTNCHYQ